MNIKLGSIYIDSSNCYYVIITITQKFSMDYFVCISPKNGRLIFVSPNSLERLATKEEINALTKKERRITVKAIFSPR